MTAMTNGVVELGVMRDECRSAVSGRLARLEIERLTGLCLSARRNSQSAALGGRLTAGIGPVSLSGGSRLIAEHRSTHPLIPVIQGERCLTTAGRALVVGAVTTARLGACCSVAGECARRVEKSGDLTTSSQSASDLFADARARRPVGQPVCSDRRFESAPADETEDSDTCPSCLNERFLCICHGGEGRWGKLPACSPKSHKLAACGYQF